MTTTLTTTLGPDAAELTDETLVPRPASPLGGPFSPAVDATAVDDLLRVTREHAAECDRDARFPLEVLATLRQTRLLGLLVPPRWGGPGGTLADVLTISHALSRECMSAGMIFAMHHQQVQAIIRHGAAELADRVLPEIAAGRVYLASVTTETGNGGALLSSDAPVRADGDNLLLHRMAPVVTGGEHADAYLVTMRASDDDAAARVSLVYAEADRLTRTTLGGWDPLGMRATRSVPMRLEGSIPAGNVVGTPGEFREVVVRTFGPLAHLGWASCWLGTASGALARTVALLRSRAERSRRDTSSDQLRARLSRVRQRLDIVHAVVAHAYQVFETADAELLGTPRAQLLLNAVKLTASEQCLAAVDELVELVGMRHGYLRNSELALERALRDLRSASLNFSNDRLHAVDGALVLLDSEVRFA